MVRTPCLPCLGPGSIPNWGTEIPEAMYAVKNKQTKSPVRLTSQPIVLKVSDISQIVKIIKRQYEIMEGIWALKSDKHALKICLCGHWICDMNQSFKLSHFKENEIGSNLQANNNRFIINKNEVP